MANRIGWLALAGALAALPATAMSGAPDGHRAIGAGDAAELCIDSNASGFGDLAEGRRRAVLIVHAARAADGAIGSFRVRPVGGQAESRIGLFPGQPFDEARGDQVRRYFLPRATVDGVASCYQIRYMAEDGEAEVSLEVSDPL